MLFSESRSRIDRSRTSAVSIWSEIFENLKHVRRRVSNGDRPENSICGKHTKYFNCIQAFFIVGVINKKNVAALLPLVARQQLDETKTNAREN